MKVTPGSTDVTTYFVLRLAADGTAATALTITDLDLQYVRSGATPAAKVDATALGAANSSHADNQAIEVDATDQPGLYRVDWPDAAFAAGVREVICTVKHTTCFIEHLRVELETIQTADHTSGIADMQARLPAALTGAGNMKSDAIAVDGSTAAATHLKDHAVTAVPVTFTSGGSTTTAVLVNVDGAAASSTDDFYNGRVLIFTAPSGLKYQATDITDYVGSTKTATITQVTAAPDGTATAIMV